MIVTLADGRRIDTSTPIDISIPLRFNGPQPNAYGVEPASSKVCEYGTLVGDTRRGGSCNFEQYSFIPHCNGTHTECVGHITNERIAVRECLRDAFVPAILFTIDPFEPGDTEDQYSTPIQPGDKLITADSIRDALSRLAPGANAGGPDSAIIIRTLPNDENKLSQLYDSSSLPPYLTTDAMRYIVGLGCKHLIADLPSIDRLFDEGRLSNHRVFWNVEQGSFEVSEKTRLASTITELIYVPPTVPDGHYLLNLQIAPFVADASPSRPLLFSAV